VRGNPEGLDALLRQGVTAGPVTLELGQELKCDSSAGEDQRASRDAFVLTEAWTLVHHVSETLLRLYLAHCDQPPCPSLEVARQRDAARFKGAVRARFVEAERTPSETFYGSATGATLAGKISADEFTAMCDSIESYMREFARTFLDANSYNAVKHGFAVQTGRSALQVDIEGVRLFDTRGPHIDYLEVVKRDDGRKRWAETSQWIDLDRAFVLLFVAQRMIGVLWDTAKWRYLGEEWTRIWRLDQLRYEDLKADDNIAGTALRRPLAYFQRRAA